MRKGEPKPQRRKVFLETERPGGALEVVPVQVCGDGSTEQYDNR